MRAQRPPHYPDLIHRRCGRCRRAALSPLPNGSKALAKRWQGMKGPRKSHDHRARRFRDRIGPHLRIGEQLPAYAAARAALQRPHRPGRLSKATASALFRIVGRRRARACVLGDAGSDDSSRICEAIETGKGWNDVSLRQAISHR